MCLFSFAPDTHRLLLIAHKHLPVLIQLFNVVPFFWVFEFFVKLTEALEIAVDTLVVVLNCLLMSMMMREEFWKRRSEPLVYLDSRFSAVKSNLVA